jgi:hypothetical protein
VDIAYIVESYWFGNVCIELVRVCCSCVKSVAKGPLVVELPRRTWLNLHNCGRAKRVTCEETYLLLPPAADIADRRIDFENWFALY